MNRLAILLLTTALAGSALAAPAGAPADAQALFAEGNAAYIEGDYGRAIEAYSAIEASGRVSPPLLENLAAAYRAAGQPGAATWAETSAAALAGERWVFVEVAGIVLAAAAVLWVLIARSPVPPRPFRILVTVAILAVVAGVAGTVISAKRFAGAIVLRDRPLLISPFEEAEPTGQLRAGEAVEIVRLHGGFALVYLPDGSHGWLPGNDVRPVLPAPS